MERKTPAYGLFMILIIITVGVAGCVTAENQATGGSGGGAQLANPASVFCADMDGTLKIITTAEGEAGYCEFPEGNVCEEWAFFRSNGTDCVAPEE